MDFKVERRRGGLDFASPIAISFTLELYPEDLDRVGRPYQEWLLAVIKGSWGLGTNAMLLRALANVIEDARLG